MDLDIRARYSPKVLKSISDLEKLPKKFISDTEKFRIFYVLWKPSKGHEMIHKP